MRKVFNTDIKNRITTVTEFSLTRTGVKKNTYATDYTNTNLVELDDSSSSTIVSAIGEPMNAIVDALTKSDDAKYKMIPCNATGALNEFVVREPLLIEAASIVVYEGYTPGSTVSVILCVGEEESVINEVTFDEPLTETYNMDLDYTSQIATEENPIRLKTVISGNENDEATSVISFKYYRLD